MFEILEKIILAGVGLANMTKENAEKLIDTLIKKGQIKAKDKKAVLSRLLKSTRKIDEGLEKKMKQISLKVLENSHKQIDALRKKIAKVNNDLHFEKRKGEKKKRKK